MALENPDPRGRAVKSVIASRRAFIQGGLVTVLCAPAIVRAVSIMPVKALELEFGIGPIMRSLEPEGLTVQTLLRARQILQRNNSYDTGFTLFISRQQEEMLRAFIK